ERLAERHERGRLVDVRAAEREDGADDRARDEPGDEQPPARPDRRTPPREVDLALRLELALAHRAATLPAAHAQWAARPSRSGVDARQPSSRSIRAVSAFVRFMSPVAGGPYVTSSRRPAICSSSACASRTVDSSPPPTL